MYLQSLFMASACRLEVVNNHQCQSPEMRAILLSLVLFSNQEHSQGQVKPLAKTMFHWDSEHNRLFWDHI